MQKLQKKSSQTLPFSRPKVSIYIASSIDGYIARKDGNLDWLHYGHTGNEDYGFKKFTNSIDAVVMGKNTYEVVAGFDDWAYKDKRVIVLSKSLNTVRKEAELFSGELTELLSKLHAENIKHIRMSANFFENSRNVFDRVACFCEQVYINSCTVCRRIPNH